MRIILAGHLRTWRPQAKQCYEHGRREGANSSSFVFDFHTNYSYYIKKKKKKKKKKKTYVNRGRAAPVNWIYYMCLYVCMCACMLRVNPLPIGDTPPRTSLPSGRDQAA